MNGYPKNHDCRERQPKHDEIDQQIADWRKSGHEIEVIPFGAVSNPQGPHFNNKARGSTKMMADDFDED